MLELKAIFERLEALTQTDDEDFRHDASALWFELSHAVHSLVEDMKEQVAQLEGDH